MFLFDTYVIFSIDNTSIFPCIIQVTYRHKRGLNGNISDKRRIACVGVPREDLVEWIIRGYVKASSETIKGNRVFREFTIEDIYSIEAFRL